MPRSLQLNLPPALVNRLDTGAESKVQKLDDAAKAAEIPLETAKAQIGRALKRTIARTDSVLKDFGDPSQVKRVCDGDVPTVIARAWQREATRREFVLALAEESGLAEVTTTVTLKRSA